MWFDDSMNSAFVAIDQGIRAAGYTALRIHQRQHNNKIDDEIIAGIRRSKFLVADFTGHRGGVYFEAGFAKGLGLEVIWLCREDDLRKLHFDTRQYSHIPWQQSKLPELTKALKDRIEATIGHGPLNEDRPEACI
jgi:nucleoside 2-deoxyribosyltransferase